MRRSLFGVTDEKQRVGLYNPWDTESYVSSDSIYPDVAYTCNLANYASWTGSAPAGYSADSTTTTGTTTTEIGEEANAVPTPTPHNSVSTTTLKGGAVERVVWETVVVTVEG